MTDDEGALDSCVEEEVAARGVEGQAPWYFRAASLAIVGKVDNLGLGGVDQRFVIDWEHGCGRAGRRPQFGVASEHRVGENAGMGSRVPKRWSSPGGITGGFSHFVQGCPPSLRPVKGCGQLVEINPHIPRHQSDNRLLVNHENETLDNRPNFAPNGLCGIGGCLRTLRKLANFELEPEVGRCLQQPKSCRRKFHLRPT